MNDRSQMAEAKVIGSTIMAFPASTPGTTSSESMQVAIDVTGRVRAIGPRTQCGSICGHDRLYVTVTLNKIFNQVVITVILNKRVARSSVSIRQLCLKREEWLGKEAPISLNKPSRRVLFKWTK